jgi:hypothetical protein
MLSCTAAPAVRHMHVLPWLRCKFVIACACALVCILPAATISACSDILWPCAIRLPGPDIKTLCSCTCMCSVLDVDAAGDGLFPGSGQGSQQACQPARFSVTQDVLSPGHGQDADPRLHCSMCLKHRCLFRAWVQQHAQKLGRRT